MAAQTITTPVNFDSPSVLGLLNGEAITVNGGALTVDSDVRWGQNAAVVGSITVSATLGGSVLFEGRNVWELRYTASTGNVPAQAALGSNGVTGGTSGATGELLRVWGSGLEPLAAGGAMPAAGWIKLRSKSGTFQPGEVVTLPGGATITISGPGKRSWLHIVGAESGTLTWGRLADVRFRGEWYELGTTTGADDQTFAFPVADACPAIWVEKYAGSYALLGEFGLEPWLSAGGRWGTAAQFVSTDVRGKYFGQDLATGVITIARRASNACGFKPAAGLKVFVPNLILSSSTSANWSANTINATMATRYETATTAGGTVDVVGVSCNWYLNATTPVSYSLQRSGILEQALVSGVAKSVLVEDVGLGVNSGTATAYSGLSLASLYGAPVLRRVRSTKATQGASIALSDVSGLRGYTIQAETFGASGAVNRSATSIVSMDLTRCEDTVISELVSIGARVRFAACLDSEIRGFQYADNLVGETQTGAQMPGAVEASGGSGQFAMYGFENFGGLANVHPATRILVANNATAVGLYDVGSPSVPYDLGTVNPANGSVNASVLRGLTVRRVYTRNGATPGTTSAVQLASTVQDVELINVWGDGDDNGAFSAVNVTAKGCKWTPTVVGQNASYGTHWSDTYTSDTTGRVVIHCNEPTDATAGQCATSFAAGSGFTSAGSVSMSTVGDFVEWTMPYFALGHTALANSAPTVTGTNAGNHTLEFQADAGSGWSAWAALTGANLAAVGAINPATGVRLRVRATVTVASASNLLTYIRIDTVTDAVSQQIQYPLPKLAALTLTGLQPGSDIVILQAGTETELANVDANGGTTYAYDYDTTTTVDIGVFKVGFVPFYVRGYTLASTDATLPIAQVADRNYRNPT